MLPDTVAFTERLLDRRKVAAVGAFTRESLELATFEAPGDFMRNMLHARLEAEVLVERVLDDEVTVPWEGDVTVAIRGAWVVLGLGSLVTLLTPLFGVAMFAIGVMLVLVAVVLLAMNEEEKVRVRGHVTVPATYWRKFPEADISYPKTLGTPVRFVEMGTPYWEQER